MKMCDYSLMALPNRLALSGEELVSHKFQTGAMGLISSAEGKLIDDAAKPKGLVQRIRCLLNPPHMWQCTAVCVPPGARLSVRDISSQLQREIGLQGDVQEVTFTQTGAGIGFRDAMRFPNGREVSLQRLSEGQRVRVLSLSSVEESTPTIEAYLVNH
jgi:hypothetical protein